MTSASWWPHDRASGNGTGPSISPSRLRRFSPVDELEHDVRLGAVLGEIEAALHVGDGSSERAISASRLNRPKMAGSAKRLGLGDFSTTVRPDSVSSAL